MQSRTLYALALVVVAALCTALTRALPFFLFGGRRRAPQVVRDLGVLLPSAIIAILVVYCLRNIDLTTAPFGAPALLGVAAVTALHLWKRSTLLSIGGGTILYMLLVQFVF